MRKLQWLSNACAKDQSDAREMYTKLQNFFDFYDASNTTQWLRHKARNNSQQNLEMSFALWAFVRSDSMLASIVYVLNLVLHPRIRMSAETRKAQLDAMYVVNLCKIGMHAEDLETWVLQFMDTLRSSPGIVVFSAYMGVQMVSSIDRIENGLEHTVSHNLRQNLDFFHFYKDRLSRRADLTQVHMQTSGMQFSPGEFIWLYREHGRLARSLQLANEESRARSQEVFRLQSQIMQNALNLDEIRTIVHALRTTFCINSETHAQILHLSRRKASGESTRDVARTQHPSNINIQNTTPTTTHPTHNALRRMYTAFESSVDGTYQQGDFVAST